MLLDILFYRLLNYTSDDEIFELQHMVIELTQ